MRTTEPRASDDPTPPLAPEAGDAPDVVPTVRMDRRALLSYGLGDEPEVVTASHEIPEGSLDPAELPPDAGAGRSSRVWLGVAVALFVAGATAAAVVLVGLVAAAIVAYALI